MNRIAAAIVCIGLAGAGAYLAVNGTESFWIWLGAFFAFLNAID